jgi:hypothetical protein
MAMASVKGVAEAAWSIAAAIERRDGAALRALLAPGFVHRSHGEETGPADAEAFVRAIEDIPGEIAFVRLEQLVIDPLPGGAFVTGMQHAQVIVHGQVVDDRRRFVDLFVEHAGEWRVQAAVDLP